MTFITGGAGIYIIIDIVVVAVCLRLIVFMTFNAGEHSIIGGVGMTI